MTVLVDIHSQQWMDNRFFREEVSAIPDSEIFFYPEFGDPAEVTMLVCDCLRPGLALKLPNLQLVQKLGAGVETMTSSSELKEEVKIARLQHLTMAMEMARFCLAFVLNDALNLDVHREIQNQAVWSPMAPRHASGLQVGVLGLGRIGTVIARMFTDAGYQVTGWSHSQKSIPDINCLCGDESLEAVLSSCDYIASVLPSTPATENLFNLDRFEQMQSDAMLINVGRGSLVVEEDLLCALEKGFLRRAVLDVCRTEPLPSDSPLWRHPAVTITPHVSGWHLDDSLKVVEENYRRLLRKKPLLNVINRSTGY